MKEYFSHDYHARSDPKLLKLRMKYGFEGIGLFWSIIEILYESEGLVMRSECERIAYELQTDKERIAAIIDTELFQKDDIYFWSESVNRRIAIRNEKSQKAKDSAYKRWENKDLKTNANALPTHSERNAIKVNKSKVNKRKENICKTREFTPPSQDEFIEYFKANGYKTDIALRAFKGYSESGWKDSQGKQVLNWKQKCQHVWFKPEHEIKNKPSEKTQAEVVEEYRKAGWNVVDY